MKAVIDTNVMLVAINPGSRFHPIFRKAISGDYQLCISNAILLEYEEIFKERITFSMADSAVAALIYSPFVLRYNPPDFLAIGCRRP
jgi:rRNA-processing protein FCF1